MSIRATLELDQKLRELIEKSRQDASLVKAEKEASLVEAKRKLDEPKDALDQLRDADLFEEDP